MSLFTHRKRHRLLLSMPSKDYVVYFTADTIENTPGITWKKQEKIG